MTIHVIGLGSELLNESWIPLLGIALVTLGLLMLLRKRRQRNAQRLTPREQVERFRQEKAMRGDLESLMVEIEQLAKRLGTQLDAKTLQIEKLLEEADARIARLRQLSDEPAARPRETAFGRPLDQGGEAETAGVSVPAGAEPAATDDWLTHSVYELADQGLTPVEIARRLSEGVGKVELILALRKA